MVRHSFLVLVGLFFLMADGAVLAQDVYVPGYVRKDGTYVRPHIRSSPNESKADNYGPSEDSSELLNPRARNADNDALPNYLDQDDDNDGIADDIDTDQYGKSRREALGGEQEEPAEE